MYPVRIGIIRGSGLYRMEGLTDTREHAVDTPFDARFGMARRNPSVTRPDVGGR